MALYWILAAGMVALVAALSALDVVPLETDLPWSAWVVAALALLDGGWMAYDGARALVTGDYVTPRSGPHCGELGPWAGIPRALGIDPRAPAVKSLFVLYGLACLAAAYGLLLGVDGAKAALIVIAALGLWYVPFGLVINVIVIALLVGTPL